MKTDKAINWHFNWRGGGYNNVSAVTREEALEKGNAMTNTLKVDESTLKEDPDFKLTLASDRAYAGMFN